MAAHSTFSGLAALDPSATWRTKVDHEQLIHPVNHAHLAAWVAVVVVVPHISDVVHKMQRPSHRHISETHTGFNDSGEESAVDVDTNIVNNN